jgi:acyl-CoA thioester hydrolase
MNPSGTNGQTNNQTNDQTNDQTDNQTSNRADNWMKDLLMTPTAPTTSEPFVHQLRVAFHETDSMGVVHHSNYVKYFEAGRVAWLRERGLMHVHIPYGPYTFAVVDLDLKFLKPAKFDDLLEVVVEASLEGVRMKFRYAIWNTRLQDWSATGSTELVPINNELRPVKPPAEIRQALKPKNTGENWPPPRAIKR